MKHVLILVLSLFVSNAFAIDYRIACKEISRSRTDGTYSGDITKVASWDATVNLTTSDPTNLSARIRPKSDVDLSQASSSKLDIADGIFEIGRVRRSNDDNAWFVKYSYTALHGNCVAGCDLQTDLIVESYVIKHIELQEFNSDLNKVKAVFTRVNKLSDTKVRAHAFTYDCSINPVAEPI